LLGGRVRYAQPATGFRSGIEPVLLAAAIPAQPGETVLEAGSGAGAGLLCLAHRVPGFFGLGIERDSSLVALAADNAAANGCASLRFSAADLLDPAAAAGFNHPFANPFKAGSDHPFVNPSKAGFDHAFANPPYHPRGGTASPDAQREAAKRGGADLLAAWCRAMVALLRPRGTLTLILPAAVFASAAAALQASGCGGLILFPLWPRPGKAAKLVLVQARRHSRGPDRLAPGLVLHDGQGFAPAAEAVLRDGAALTLDRG
jgi:tRNA1(Val) A37 N6-methylase TrmN6